MEIYNNPEIIHWLGVTAVNAVFEADLYMHINSTHISGSRRMNSIGGKTDFTKNA
jgi:succinyl-CoA:acetate CoA-transferase